MSLAAGIVSQMEQHGIPHAVSRRALGVSQAWFYKWRSGRYLRGLGAGRRWQRS